MDNFSQTQMGYNKQEVNEFVDYVIKKTEENVDTIKNQNDEIRRLARELDNYKKIENTTNEMKNIATREANLIIKEAKDNASRIVNDALLKSQRVEQDREALNKSIRLYKKRMRSALMEQLDLIEDVEIL